MARSTFINPHPAITNLFVATTPPPPVNWNPHSHTIGSSAVEFHFANPSPRVSVFCIGVKKQRLVFFRCSLSSESRGMDFHITPILYLNQNERKRKIRPNITENDSSLSACIYLPANLHLCCWASPFSRTRTHLECSEDTRGSVGKQWRWWSCVISVSVYSCYTPPPSAD